MVKLHKHLNLQGFQFKKQIEIFFDNKRLNKDVK